MFVYILSEDSCDNEQCWYIYSEVHPGNYPFLY